jgi:S-formylglutathione hydrolase FrmB
MHDRLTIARTAADNLLIEAAVGLSTYVERDRVEDDNVRALFARLRTNNAGNPAVVSMLDAWQHAWEVADAAADGAADRLAREIRTIADELRSALLPAKAAGQAG